MVDFGVEFCLDTGDLTGVSKFASGVSSLVDSEDSISANKVTGGI